MRSALERSNKRLSTDAQRVRRAGRAGDSMLVHVNPREKREMDRMFGPASTNPHTGLPEHGFFSKIGKTLGFEGSHMVKFTKNVLKNPWRGSFFLNTPIGTKLLNKATGKNYQATVGQLGGSTQAERDAYEEKHGEGSLGYANSTNAAANTIAGFYAGQGVGNLAGKAAGQLGASAGVAGAVGNVTGNVAVGQANQANADEYARAMEAAAGKDGKLSKKEATSLLLTRAGEIANRPYESYLGQRVAPLTRNEQMASEMARTRDPRVMENLDEAESAIRASTKEFNRENLESYLSPYRDSAIERQNEQYDRARASLLNSKAGAWGGDRAAFEASELDRQHFGQISDINAQAYRDATQAFFSDADRHARASDAWRAVAGDRSQLNRQQIQDLMATGGIERALDQAQLDFDYQQFVEARDWDITNLGPLLAALGTTGQPTANPKGDNTAAALGAAATIAGAYFQGGGGGSSSAPAASTPTSYTPAASSGSTIGPPAP